MTQPLHSVHTTSFPELLASLGSSLAVSTYQAGKLVLLRPERRGGESGGGEVVLNTHFRAFNKPMGLAWESGRLALGTSAEVWEFHDMPAVARKLDRGEYPGAHDAAYLPRGSHVTGDVQIHEMAWVTPARNGSDSAVERSGRLSELYFVNTRFSCLAVRGGQYSFIPRWTPHFISGLAPEDRCHLNGLGLRDGVARYVTALGATDTAGGWRVNKRSGGIVMDVPSNEIIVEGLSMPHSPRWHEGKLWVLESGNGGFGVVDEGSGRYREICRLPGFTRGLDFAGPYAFVGLSQVRETAVFGDIAISEMKQEERSCGVWAIDTRSGRTVGFVKFMDAVQEIFAVQIMHGLVWPEVLSEDSKRIAESYELPEEALSKVPADFRTSVPNQAPTSSVVQGELNSIVK